MVLLLCIFMCFLPSFTYAQDQSNHVEWCSATGGGLIPCQSQASSIPVVPVPKRMSFQAKVTQANFPILEGKIPKLTVVYNTAGSQKCKEEFTNVIVQDGVLNLELGQGTYCSFNWFINQNLNSMQICLAHAASGYPPDSSCFDASSDTLGFAPSAVKSYIAYQAELAYLSQRVNESHYAYPFLRLSNTEGQNGQFIFAPPLNTFIDPFQIDAQSASVETLHTQGFLTWLASNSIHKDLNFSRANQENLDDLVLGGLTVDFSEDLTVNQQLDIKGNLEVNEGKGEVYGNLEIQNQGLNIEAGGMDVKSTSSLAGPVSIASGLLNLEASNTLNSPGLQVHNLWVKGALTLDLLKSQNLTFNHQSLDRPISMVQGSSTFLFDSASDQLTFNVDETTTISDGGILLSQGALLVDHNVEIYGNLDVVQSLSLNGSLGIHQHTGVFQILSDSGSTLMVNQEPDGSEAFDEIEIEGEVEYRGPVTFDPPLNDTTLGSSECSIERVRAWTRVKNQNNEWVKTLIDPPKYIDQVFDLVCGDQRFRVSTVLQSICGDGVREGKEACDDHENNQSDPLSSYCKSAPSEAFDLAQIDSNDEMNVSNWCTFPCTGLQSELEQTECQKRRRQEIQCRTSCQYAGCGDGIVDDKERCDDGNDLESDDCDNQCKLISNCKLGVRRRIQNESTVIRVDTSVSRDQRALIENESQIYESNRWESTGVDPSTRFICGDLSQTGNFEQIARQAVIEFDLDTASYVAFETLNQSPNDYDPVLFLRDQCSDVEGTHCNDDGGGNLRALIDQYEGNVPQNKGVYLERGRHYLVVGGRDNADVGTTDVAIRMLCSDPKRYVGSLNIRNPDTLATTQSFNVDTSQDEQGGLGYVHTECIERFSSVNFVQPTSDLFDPQVSNPNIGYGRQQAVVEVIIVRSMNLEVSVTSNTIDPVVYLQNSCDSESLLPPLQGSVDLNCDDNSGTQQQGTNFGSFRGVPYLVRTLNPGVYYVVVDSSSSSGGQFSIDVSLTATDDH